MRAEAGARAVAQLRDNALGQRVADEDLPRVTCELSVVTMRMHMLRMHMFSCFRGVHIALAGIAAVCVVPLARTLDMCVLLVRAASTRPHEPVCLNLHRKGQADGMRARLLHALFRNIGCAHLNLS